MSSARQLRVRSSWVGPNPPHTMTASARDAAERIAPTIRSALSPTFDWYRQSIPASASCSPIHDELVSTIWPSNNSVPTATTSASKPSHSPVGGGGICPGGGGGYEPEAGGGGGTVPWGACGACGAAAPGGGGYALGAPPTGEYPPGGGGAIPAPGCCPNGEPGVIVGPPNGCCCFFFQDERTTNEMIHNTSPMAQSTNPPRSDPRMSTAPIARSPIGIFPTA